MSARRFAVDGRAVDASGARPDDNGEPRERWRITLGSRTRLELDERKLPTGAVSPWAPKTFAPGEDDDDEPIASFEPMAAPGDALVTGNDLPWAPWRMQFTIRVRGA